MVNKSHRRDGATASSLHSGGRYLRPGNQAAEWYQLACAESSDWRKPITTGRRCCASFTYRAGSSGWKSVWQITQGFGWCRSCFLQTWTPEYQSLAIRAAENIYRTNPSPSLYELRRVLFILWLWSCGISTRKPNISLSHSNSRNSSVERGKREKKWCVRGHSEFNLSPVRHPGQVLKSCRSEVTATLTSDRNWGAPNQSLNTWLVFFFFNIFTYLLVSAENDSI